ncbi:MAG TPA: formate--tetrahydrofolate ligase [Firmicutes bacterium]|nr:formate--tetrahydrofolate ligase [Bacillota bacterium]
MVDDTSVRRRNVDGLSTSSPPPLRPVGQVAAGLGLSEDDLEYYGPYKAKVRLSVWEKYRLAERPQGKLIYVTAITPTPAGEGKTTTAIGLTQALGRLGKRVALCLREPSLGPTFGVKGGATGGGRAQVVPAEEINLHFTGDIHAVGSAHNLLAAVIDNHIHQGNRLGIDPRRVLWRRVMDMNDRQLRQIVVGLGGPANGVPRETGFDITVASEVMAILCLARDLVDLEERLGRMLVAYTYEGAPVYARDLKVTGAMTALLRDAIKPNLVQTLEGQPAFIHGGPFANIAHGNNSIIATGLALRLADYVVTEGGFASELGAEKFFDIVAPLTGFRPEVAVLVASVRALHHHGGAPRSRLAEPNEKALVKGFANLDKHVENLRQFGLPVVVAINRFASDSPAELSAIESHCQQDLQVPAAISDVVAEGGQGGVALAEKVLAEIGRGDFHPLFPADLPIREKVDRIARTLYGADGVDYLPEAEASLEDLAGLGYERLPVCVAKTQSSLSDNPRLRGAPRGWRLTVREIRPSLGAGFVVALAGEILTMPGLPAEPAAERVRVTPEGEIIGVF